MNDPVNYVDLWGLCTSDADAGGIKTYSTRDTDVMPYYFSDGDGIVDKIVNFIAPVTNTIPYVVNSAVGIIDTVDNYLASNGLNLDALTNTVDVSTLTQAARHIGPAVTVVSAFTRTKITDSRISKVLAGATQRTDTKRWAIQHDKSGGMNAANADFDSLKPTNITPIDKGRRGVLLDGREVNVRNTSSGGSPTLEIQNYNNTQTKIRYGEAIE